MSPLKHFSNNRRGATQCTVCIQSETDKDMIQCVCVYLRYRLVVPGEGDETQDSSIQND